MTAVKRPGSKPRETVYYPWRRGVLVTSRRFCALGKCVPVADLLKVTVGEGEKPASRRFTAQIVGVEGLVVMAMVALTPSVRTVLVGLAYLVIATATVWFSVRRWPAPLELWATRRSNPRAEPTLLFVSHDHTEFGQVGRALQRAIERHDQDRW